MREEGLKYKPLNYAGSSCFCICLCIFMYEPNFEDNGKIYDILMSMTNIQDLSLLLDLVAMGILNCITTQWQ